MKHTVKKIAIIGGECTGKSTLCKQLASALHTQWVPEYARFYLEKKNSPYAQSDLSIIAQGQVDMERMLLPQAKNILICDTNAFVIKVWSEHAYGNCASNILQYADHNLYDAYIVCNVDMPWVFDPLREHPDEKMRKYFFDIYKKIAATSGLPYMVISGDEKTRLRKALWFIKEIFNIAVIA